MKMNENPIKTMQICLCYAFVCQYHMTHTCEYNYINNNGVLIEFLQMLVQILLLYICLS